MSKRRKKIPIHQESYRKMKQKSLSIRGNRTGLRMGGEGGERSAV